jgi:Zn-dependent protease with chaperone function
MLKKIDHFIENQQKVYTKMPDDEKRFYLSFLENFNQDEKFPDVYYYSDQEGNALAMAGKENSIIVISDDCPSELIPTTLLHEFWHIKDRHIERMLSFDLSLTLIEFSHQYDQLIEIFNGPTRNIVKHILRKDLLILYGYMISWNNQRKKIEKRRRKIRKVQEKQADLYACLHAGPKLCSLEVEFYASRRNSLHLSPTQTHPKNTTRADYLRKMRDTQLRIKRIEKVIQRELRQQKNN